MESLWPNINNSKIEKNNAIKILREQAKAIKTLTNGKINATFSKVSYSHNTNTVLTGVGTFLNAFSNGTSEETVEEELKNKTDINELYSTTEYKFEIFNEDYRFRLFILNYREFFPISMDVDEGILEEVKYTNYHPINSNAELKNYLKQIFGSIKVQTVIAKMIGNSDDE